MTHNAEKDAACPVCGLDYLTECSCTRQPPPDAEKDAPKHGDRSQCLECGGRIHYIEYYQWAGTHYEVLDAWWAHDVHPGDDHEARVLPPGVSDQVGD